MSRLKVYTGEDVYSQAKSRISYVFDNFERIYLSFSAGKDSTVMMHLVTEEAIKRNRKIGILFIDLEAQYAETINTAIKMFDTYKDNIELYWICLPISLRNAVSNYDPKWTCWDPHQKDLWVRTFPKHNGVITDPTFFPFFQPGFEFEEFVPEFAKWYSLGKPTACFVGIRADESLNRFRTIASKTKIKYNDKTWTPNFK